MFKWGHPLRNGTELFPATIQSPPILRTRVQQPPYRNDYDYSKASLEQLAAQLLDRMRPQIIQWALTQRQQAEISGLTVYQTQQTFSGVSATYVRVNGSREELELVLAPVPPVKGGDERCLLVLHDEHKVTAISMQELEVEKVQSLSAKLSRTLTTSNWGTELLKASHFKFTKEDQGVTLSAVNIQNNVITRGEVHYFASEANKFTTFVASSSLAARTPFLNGGDKTYYGPLDTFTLASSGPTYGGSHGNGNTPEAIAADGTKYYKIAIKADMFTLSSFEMQELDALDYLRTDEYLESYITALEADYPGSINGGALMPWLSASQYNAFYTATQASGELIQGAAGYGVYSGGYTTIYKISTTDASTSGGGLLQVRTDLSTDIPMSVFTQENDLDVLAVNLVPATTSHVYNFFVPPGNTTISASVQFLHLNYSMYKPPGAYVAGTPVHPYISDFWSENAPYYRTWLITYPPSLGTQDGEYYFGSDGTLRTPHGQLTYTFTPPGVNHPYIMQHIYKPWFHLSNGKTYLQAFEVNDVRHVYCKSTEITEMLATACGTDISNIQGCLIDFPLAKIRDLA